MDIKQLLSRFDEVGIKDVPLVGGKNASLGEMRRFLVPKGVNVPGGFIVTADGYRYFLRETGLTKFIKDTLEGLNTKKLKDLAKRGRLIRDKISETRFPADLEAGIAMYYVEMEREYGKGVDVAVRSSATAEDLPDASFAGEHETYLNIRGAANVVLAVRKAMASLFTDRAISYRVDKGFNHFEVALSVGVQKMVRSDKGSSGVMFTLDTESGFKDVIIINASWGLGEMIVKGEVTPDEFLVSKKSLERAGKEKITPIISKLPGKKDRKMIYSSSGGVKATKVVAVSPSDRMRYCVSDEDVARLANWGILIEEHYSSKAGRWSPMDIEWAKDGESGELYIVQARPETIHARRDFNKVTEYARETDGQVIVTGASVGNKIAAGKARVILNVKNVTDFKEGEILVTDMTDPDWEPIMKIASAIVTDKGGRTSHAAIVSRELGIPCIVGSGNATSKIKTGDLITVDTTGSLGAVYKGQLKWKTTEHNFANMKKPVTKVMMNIATPETAFVKSMLPNAGVGLAREEFIIASEIGIHPMALINYSKLSPKLRRAIEEKTGGAKDKPGYYVNRLAYGIAKIATAFYPRPVIVRFSDFKTNEYRSLLGGELYEPEEENPMLGWRGASRYYDPKFKEAFALECRAIGMVRREMGFENVIPMIPFCRTTEEADKVLSVMAENGLDRKKDHSLKIYVMCEIPSNVILADQFLERFDGMSIGSNDLAQLTLGLDRDSGIVSKVSNENNEAVKTMVSQAIRSARAKRKYIGICGQAPSDYPEFAKFLVREGIESISLNPDTIVPTTLKILEAEKEKATGAITEKLKTPELEAPEEEPELPEPVSAKEKFLPKT